jgi:hypothetical protein
MARKKHAITIDGQRRADRGDAVEHILLARLVVIGLAASQRGDHHVTVSLGSGFDASQFEPGVMVHALAMQYGEQRSTRPFRDRGGYEQAERLVRAVARADDRPLVIPRRQVRQIGRDSVGFMGHDRPPRVQTAATRVE